MAVAPIKYYTYKPGAPNVPAGRAGDVAPTLKPGETLGHSGSGYFINPAPVVNTPAITVPSPQPAVTGTWKMPDYNSLIAGDWQVTGAESGGEAAKKAAEAGFQESLRRAFVDYGGDASKLGDYSKYIDQPTIDAAQQNKFSQVALNLQAMTKALRQRRAALAARGILSSGQATADTTAALNAREQSDYAALRSFLGGAETGQQGLAQTWQDIADKIAAAREAAAARIYQAYQPEWIPDTPAATDYGYSTDYSVPPPQSYSQPVVGPWSTGTGIAAVKPLPSPRPAAATSAPAYARAPTLAQAQSAYQAAAVPVPKKKK